MIQQIIKKTQPILAVLVVGILVTISASSIASAQVQPGVTTNPSSASGGTKTTTPSATSTDPCASASIVAFPHWYDNGLCKDGKIVSPNEVGGIPKFVTIIAMNIVTIMLMVVGYVALAFIIWGGFKYIYSGDNPNGVVAARKTILNAVIGLVLSIMSVAIVKVIAGTIA